MLTESDFPTSTEIAVALKRVRDNFTDAENAECEVRLQVYSSGDWAVRWGLSDYDLDHNGYWGSSYVSHDDTDKAIQDTADYLRDQCIEAAAMADDFQEDEPADVPAGWGQL